MPRMSRPSATALWSRVRSGSNNASLSLPRTSGVLNRAIKNEVKKNQRHTRVPPTGAGRACGQWVGNQEAQRLKHEFQQRRAERLERRKQEKRERKARGARGASSSGSSSGESASDAYTTHSGESSGPSTPPHAARDEDVAQKLGAASETLASATMAYRRIRTSVRAHEATDSRLRGADLYVVRLLQDVESKAKAKEQRRRHQRAASLPTPPPPSAAPRYADSRPCWRCLEWMLWAGIKRVYWTNTEGEWHGGKVSTLLFGPEGPTASHPALVPVHLTQYEHAAAMLRAQRPVR